MYCAIRRHKLAHQVRSKEWRIDRPRSVPLLSTNKYALREGVHMFTWWSITAQSTALKSLFPDSSSPVGLSLSRSLNCPRYSKEKTCSGFCEIIKMFDPSKTKAANTKKIQQKKVIKELIEQCVNIVPINLRVGELIGICFYAKVSSVYQ